MVSKRKRLEGIAAACVISFAAQVAFAIPAEDKSGFGASEACVEHLRAVVAYLQQTAWLEGTPLTVEWKAHAKALLTYDDFVQRMWCQGDEMHVDYLDAAR